MSVQDQTAATTVDATEAPAEATHGVLLTDVAAAKVKSLLEQEGRDDLRLRVGVQPGGCSGLIYQLYFDERTLDGDLVRDFEGVEVVVDRMSSPYLAEATIDFADTIEKQGFTMDNPTPAAPAPAATRSARAAPQLVEHDSWTTETHLGIAPGERTWPAHPLGVSATCVRVSYRYSGLG